MMPIHEMILREALSRTIIQKCRLGEVLSSGSYSYYTPPGSTWISIFVDDDSIYMRRQGYNHYIRKIKESIDDPAFDPEKYINIIVKWIKNRGY